MAQLHHECSCKQAHAGSRVQMWYQIGRKVRPRVRSSLLAPFTFTLVRRCARRAGIDSHSECTESRLRTMPYTTPVSLLRNDSPLVIVCCTLSMSAVHLFAENTSLWSSCYCVPFVFIHPCTNYIALYSIVTLVRITVTRKL